MLLDAADLQDLDPLRATARGGRAAFESLFRRHHPRLLRFLWRSVPCTELAEEIVSESLGIVRKQASSFRGESPVRTWITGSAYRCMLRALSEGSPANEMNESALSDFLAIPRCSTIAFVGAA